ncbi:EAL domain-containing protein [Paracidovorax sp. MALMAid1276]|uniref:EAL domain-containing protein n=1 Tax=Paracidovorax sp. MALMAid1276 TaxID=3411631 RepID=UPI003B9D66C3
MPHRQTLLIVDDSVANLQLLAQTLEADYDVQFARSGHEALQLLKNSQPDLFILDVMMAGMDGFELCERIQALPQFRDAPIVFLTALDDEASESRGLELGAADFINKPFNVNLVRLRVGNLLKRVAMAKELEDERELLRITLHSIGDGVITTDRQGNVALMNGVAEQLTGWLQSEAQGLPFDQVFTIVHERSRRSIRNPAARSLAEERIVGLPNNTLLIARDGGEYLIEDSAAPIRDRLDNIVGAVVVFHDVTEQRRKINEAFAFSATHDALTGLINSTEFDVRISRVLKQTEQDQGLKHCLLLIDLDQFRLANEACGHDVGDRVLQNTAGMIEKCIRAGDTLARLGGDEFAVLLENCPTRSGQLVAEAICERLDRYRFIHDQHRFRIGASIGLVEFDHRWTSAAALLQAADTACVAAKEAGRNRVHTYFNVSETVVRQRAGVANWATRLDMAMELDHFILFAQRIEPLQDTRLPPSLEILLRLRDGQGELVSPGVFIPAAERYHIAARLDLWVLNKAIELLRQCRDLSGFDKISINLSGQSIGDRKVHARLVNAIRNSGLPEGKLCFEVTETSAIRNIEDAINIMGQLKTLGVKFALDDFGSGSSSFGYLKALPVDYLKIDGQFVRSLATDQVDFATVRCIADMASLLHKETVAEFVETEAALSIVSSLGVDYAQGFLLHKPEPLSQLLHLPADVDAPRGAIMHEGDSESPPESP